jgi:hypothetical protein
MNNKLEEYIRMRTQDDDANLNAIDYNGIETVVYHFFKDTMKDGLEIEARKIIDKIKKGN